MRKLDSDIRKTTKRYERIRSEYEKARVELQALTDLKEVERLDEDGVKPNLQNVRQYGAYLSGVRAAIDKILQAYFTSDSAGSLSSKEDRMLFEADLRLAIESKISVDRWITGYPHKIFEAVEKDKKGKTTKYKASWYVERTIKQKI